MGLDDGRKAWNVAIEHDGEHSEWRLKTDFPWRFFPSDSSVILVNAKSGLVARIDEKDHYGLMLSVYSLHNSADRMSDTDCTLSTKCVTIQEAFSGLQDIVI